MDIPWSPVQRRRLEELQAAGPEAAAEIDRLFSGEAERKVFSLATLLNGADFMAHAVEIVIAGEVIEHLKKRLG